MGLMETAPTRKQRRLNYDTIFDVVQFQSLGSTDESSVSDVSRQADPYLLEESG